MRVLSKGGQQKMVFSVNLAEEVPWPNFLWEKFIYVGPLVSCFSTHFVNLSLENDLFW